MYAENARNQDNIPEIQDNVFTIDEDPWFCQDFCPDHEIALSMGASADAKVWNTPKTPGTLMNVRTLLSTYKVGPKDGSAFLQGRLAGKERGDGAMAEISLIGVDVDNGMSSVE